MGFPAAAGKPVTRATAIRVAAVLSSVKTLANDIAKMPLPLYEQKTVDGRVRTQYALNEPLYSLLKYVPNRWQTSFELRWFLASQLIMNGNCYCQKITDQKGDIVELTPLNAWSMRVGWDYNAPLTNASGDRITTIDKRTGKKVPALCWEYQDGNSQIQKFYQPDIWHVKAHNLEGIGVQGASMIALSKEAISVLIAAEEYAGRNFANGLGMGGFISFPADVEVDEKQAQGVVDDLKKQFSGSQNAGKFTMIPYGGKFEKMTFNPQESQLLESRKWNEETIARAFGGAPLVVKLGYGQQNSTYASSSAFLDEYFNTSLMPYTTAIEQSVSRDLIAAEDRSRLYVKHNADVILRGSPKERAETNKELIMSGQMTLNEARALEDRDYIEGGDVLTLPANACVFDIEEQEWFIPGQKDPEPEGTADGPVDEKQPTNEPDASGASNDNNETEPVAPKKPRKPKARLEMIAKKLAERIERKAAKVEVEPKFVADVLSCSTEAAEQFCSNYKSMTPDEMHEALVQIVVGDNNDSEN